MLNSKQPESLSYVLWHKHETYICTEDFMRTDTHDSYIVHHYTS